MAADTQGTTTVTLDPASGAVGRAYADPYGNDLAASGAAGLAGPALPGLGGGRGFLNDPVASPAGLVVVGARAYDPTTGRFTSVDPLLDPGDPGQWNGYAYAGGNPVTFSDPSGAMFDSHDGYGGGGGVSVYRPAPPRPRYHPSFYPTYRSSWSGGWFGHGCGWGCAPRYVPRPVTAPVIIPTIHATARVDEPAQSARPRAYRPPNGADLRALVMGHHTPAQERAAAAEDRRLEHGGLTLDDALHDGAVGTGFIAAGMDTIAVGCLMSSPEDGPVGLMCSAGAAAGGTGAGIASSLLDGWDQVEFRHDHAAEVMDGFGLMTGVGFQTVRVLARPQFVRYSGDLIQWSFATPTDISGFAVNVVGGN